MGRDGLIGSSRLVSSGGVVLAQDQASSAIWGMPRAVAETGLATAVGTRPSLPAASPPSSGAPRGDKPIVPAHPRQPA
jgi:chemotaxis response regulator CheB